MRNHSQQVQEDVLNPVARFLEKEAVGKGANDSRLGLVAQREFQRPVDLEKFRTELLHKLKNVLDSQSAYANKPKFTFYQRLEEKGLLPVFLSDSNLRAISHWLTLREVCRTDRELEANSLSVERYPLRFHGAVVTELFRHEDAMIAIASKHKVPWTFLEAHFSAGHEEEMRQLRIILASRWPGSREALLGKHSDQDVVSAIGIFDLLKGTFGKRLSERFLRRLSLLICVRPNETEISNSRDEALRQALRRR